MQKLINKLYRIPKSKLKTYKRFGGFLNYRKIISGNEQMEKAMYNLPESPSHEDGLQVYFLTGKKYIHQTLFCIRSLLKVSTEKFKFILVDDGTFTDELVSFTYQKLPAATIITADQIAVNLAKYLPEDKFPVLNYKRKIYPHIRKLTDIHTAEPLGWKVVLDSDMLFWNEPKVLIEWLKHPAQPIHMVDCEESYGYSNNLMSNLCGTTIPDLLNVGIIGLNSQQIKWESLEQWVKKMEETEGTSYYLEQALTAMLIGDTSSIVLDKDDYKVNPTFADLKDGKNTLHHYVDLSKEIYLKNAWHLVHE